MGSIKNTVKTILTRRQDHRYQKEFDKRKCDFHSWITEKEAKRSREDDILEMEKPEYLLYDADAGSVSESLDAICGAYFARNPEILIAYGDEDYRNPEDGMRSTPWFKPVWSPDLYACSFYFGNLVAVRRDFLEKVRMRPDARGRSMKELVDLCVEEAGGYEPGCRTIGHIPEMLFHHTKEGWLSKFLPDSENTEIYMQEQMEKFRRKYLMGEQGSEKPVVSIIIPSKDNPSLLADCVAAVTRTLTKPFPLEVIVVDNGSSLEHKKEIGDMLERACREGIKTRYIYDKAEFNFSHMCNTGADAAKGKFLLLLNDDVELCQKDCLLRLAALADRKFTGAVGMKLYYPESVKIQHAGVTNLPMGPVHKLQTMEDDRLYYGAVNRGLRNFSAVTAACLMVAKEKYREVGGFPEVLRVAYNDVDFGFSLYEKGYFNVCDNECFAYHHESLSRGNDDTPEKAQRLLDERTNLYERHPGMEEKDPFFPDGLERNLMEPRIRLEYEIYRMFLQECTHLKKKKLDKYKYDGCLYFRIEWCIGHRMQGYALVLGDNNAYYEKELLLKDEGDEGVVYAVKLANQYRVDLVENMPDQLNVGLCGFHIRLDDPALEGKKWIIGMAARNLTNRTKLYYWCKKCLDLREAGADRREASMK